MGASSFSRRTRNGPVAVATAVAGSSSVDMRDMVGGVLLVSGVTATHAFSVFASGDAVTFAALHDGGGSASTISVGDAGGAYYLPDAVFATKFVRFVADADIGTAAAVEISLKS